jgi:MFS family permease
MVAFLTALVAVVAIGVLIELYGRHRPLGTPFSWGEAMVGAVISFFWMFLAFGVLPHQWLTYAGNELGWRKDKLILGPADIVEKYVPFTVSYEAIQDIVVTVIYFGAGTAIASTATRWQKRGTKKPKEIETSAFGRPLVEGS